MSQITAEAAATLKGLASGQRAVLDGLLGLQPDPGAAGSLDRRTQALLTLAALVGVNGATPEHHAQVRVALRAGASVEDIVGVLVAVAPYVGTSRIVTAAAAIADALGVEIPDPGGARPIRSPPDIRGR
jgi:4-carboxymuconolactone decarboxylase